MLVEFIINFFHVIGHNYYLPSKICQTSTLCEAGGGGSVCVIWGWGACARKEALFRARGLR